MNKSPCSKLSIGIEGVDIDLVNILSDKLGFSWEVRHGTSWIEFDSEGNVVGGIIGEVGNRESDIAVGHLTTDRIPPQKKPAGVNCPILGYT